MDGMEIALAIFRIGVGVGALLVGLGLLLTALALRPVARDLRSLANDARRLARLTEEELPALARERAVERHQPDVTEDVEAAPVGPVQSVGTREGEHIA
jgi:hypothetical protein